MELNAAVAAKQLTASTLAFAETCVALGVPTMDATIDSRELWMRVQRGEILVLDRAVLEVAAGARAPGETDAALVERALARLSDPPRPAAVLVEHAGDNWS